MAPAAAAPALHQADRDSRTGQAGGFGQTATWVEPLMYAHSAQGIPAETWEPLSHHLSSVAGRAADFAAVFGWAEAARAAGILHDVGKASRAYQTYIATPRIGGSGPRGPDHSTAGAREAIAAYPGALGRMLACAIAGHHAGLGDGEELDRRLAPDYDLKPYGG